MSATVSVNLFCHELDRVFEFYRALLDAPEIGSRRSPVYRALALTNGVIGFHAPAAVELLDASAFRAARPAVAHYPTFHVESALDVDAMCARARAQGGTVHKAAYVTYYQSLQAVLLDPEGNFFRVDHDLRLDAGAAEAPAVVRDMERLREVIALSQQARDEGRHPFAALVASEEDVAIARALNESSVDRTCHAEVQALRRASRLHAPAELGGATLYSSAEPCAMCAGAAYWAGVGRVVYALSETRLLSLTGAHAENPTLSMPCREIFARGQRRVVVRGPLLEEEAAAVHEGFWQP